MVFLDTLTSQVLWSKFLKNETNSDYQEGLNYLESKGFEILGVVSDGRRGLSRVFSKYPYQVCQFHIQKGVSTLLTRNPKSPAGKDLKRLNDKFIKGKLTKSQFLQEIETYLKTNQDYLNELSENHPTTNKTTNKVVYKHQRLRKAINKYKNNIKYMFTYQSNPQLPSLQIPNTTNHIDGGLFSPMKKLLNNHNGLSKPHRKTWIILFLNSRGKDNT